MRRNLPGFMNYRDEHTAHKATLFATLESGPFTSQYNDQAGAVDDIKRLVFKHLSGFRENRRTEKQDLFLQRRVFEKVSARIALEISVLTCLGRAWSDGQVFFQAGHHAWKRFQD